MPLQVQVEPNGLLRAIFLLLEQGGHFEGQTILDLFARDLLIPLEKFQKSLFDCFWVGGRVGQKKIHLHIIYPCDDGLVDVLRQLINESSLQV